MSAIHNVVGKVRRITCAGMAVNLLLAALKATVGVLFASQALVADAVHSLSDLLTDLAVIFGVRYWESPPDREHPYGHGKIQALVTLFIAVLLLGVAWRLCAEAIDALHVGARGTPGTPAFVLALVSIAAKEALYHATVRVARHVKSPALEANAWHHRSDAISSVPVAIAVALSHFFPSLWWADAAGALVVAVFIAVLVWTLSRSALQELTDAQIGDTSESVARVARGVPGVRSVHCCRARRYGGAFQADLHIQVDPTLSVVEGHSLCHKVKDALIAAGLDVVDAIIHVEPYDPKP